MITRLKGSSSARQKAAVGDTARAIQITPSIFTLNSAGHLKILGCGARNFRPGITKTLSKSRLLLKLVKTQKSFRRAVKWRANILGSTVNFPRTQTKRFF